MHHAHGLCERAKSKQGSARGGITREALFISLDSEHGHPGTPISLSYLPIDPFITRHPLRSASIAEVHASMTSIERLKG